MQFGGAYTLIRSDYDDKFPSKLAAAVRNVLNDAGADVALKTDFVSERTGDFASDNELLISPTEREESVAALEEYKLDEKEFLVRLYGTRIVLLAGSDNAYFAAADWLAERFDPATGVLSLPESGYIGRWTPVLEGLTIDGSPVGEYTIVFGNYLGLVSKSDAEKLQETIYDMTGETLVISDKETFSGGKAIRLCDPALASLTIKAAEGAHPVINGAVSVPEDSFVKVEGTDYYMAKINSDVKVRDIFVDGKRLPLARSESKRILVNFDNTEDKSDPANAKGLYLDAELVKSLGEVSYPTEFVIYVEWEFHRLHVTGVDPDDTKTVDGRKLVRVKFDEKEFAGFPSYINGVLSIMNREYYFENNVSLLTPGTCVADYANGVLYYYPENGKPTVVSCSTNEVLMSFKSVANLSVEGISFTGLSCNFVAEHGFKSEQANADKNAGVLNCAAILLTDCVNTKVTGCSFTGLGGNGVQSRRSQNGLTITDCVFDDLAMSAMALGEHTTDWSVNTADYNFTIDNNRITNVGYGFQTAVAIYISHVDGLKLTHNTIDNCAYSGVSLGWGWSITRMASGSMSVTPSLLTIV